MSRQREFLQLSFCNLPTLSVDFLVETSLLGGGAPESFASALAGFNQGLQEIGIVEGRNAEIEARWARGDYGRLPGLAADLVARGPSVIVTQTLPAALAAKAATTKIPIVFVIGEDPVEVGLVQTLNRPGGNVTGLSNFMNLLAAKRLEVLSETVPNANALALLVNPNNPNADPDTKNLQAAAQALGRRIEVLRAASEDELETAFAAMTQQRLGALFVKPDELARRICHLAMEGERDPVRLHDQALGELIPATMWLCFFPLFRPAPDSRLATHS